MKEENNIKSIPEELVYRTNAEDCRYFAVHAAAS